MNSIQIDEILNTIKTTSPTNSSPSYPQSPSLFNSRPTSPSPNPNSTAATRIENIEMPTTMNFTHVTASSGARNGRRKRSFVFKAAVGCSLALLILFFIVVPFYKPQDEEASLYRGETVYSSKKTFNYYENTDGKKNGKENLPDYAPVKHDDDEKKEAKKIEEKKSQAEDDIEKSAAEMLQCPAGVINFVINATDAKDECDGLRKAFDQTCGGEKEKEQSSKGLRRMLSEIYENDPNDTSCWNESLKSVISGINAQFRRLLETEEDSQEHQMASEVEDDDTTDTTEKIDEKKDEKIETKPLSPSLPTGSNHMSDQMAEDALGLNSELTDIAKAIEEIGNSTETFEKDKKSNKGKNKNDKDEGSKPTKDITSTAVAVSAIMNNPEVIETQSCCRSILQVFHEECDNPDDEEYADRRLFVIVCVIAICGMIKSLIRHFNIRWLPEAGGCILVGVVGGLFLKILPNMDFAFSHDMFLRVMVPPIVFEAALNINKKSFTVMLVPIVMLAVFGTIMSTFLTAGIVFYGTHYLKHCTSIPFIESLAFGALISSIDPIAVLSVLNNMGMSDKDQIYVIIFGEALLNDGVAIVLFQTLLNFMDENLVIDGEAVYIATLQFLVIAFGSLFVGLASGVSSTLYFWLMQGIQTPLIEVIMFICWAFIPYYVCDGIEWSGIVAIVAVGFFMDIYIIGQKSDADTDEDNLEKNPGGTGKRRPVRHAMFSQKGFLSAKAQSHIRFVTEINSTLMETAIFSYLGLFLFNKRYHWSFLIPVVAIVSCLSARAVTVWFFSFASNIFNQLGSLSMRRLKRSCGRNNNDDRPPRPVIIDARMQTVLIFAGLRGAMSFALVETVPMFDESTRQGSRFKPELKAMTSACIVFTVFILGGYTDYLLEKVGLKPTGDDSEDVEMVSLMNTSEISNQTDQWESSGELKQRSAATRAIVNDDRMW